MLNEIKVYLVEVFGLPNRGTIPYRFIAVTNKTATEALDAIKVIEGVGSITKIDHWSQEGNDIAAAKCELKHFNNEETSELYIVVDGRIACKAI